MKIAPKLKRITEDDVTRLIDQAFIFSFFYFYFYFYFKDSTGTAPGVHQFKVGMKFEAIDPFNPSHVCVVTVIKVLRFNYFVLGVDSLATYFVCHANSINVFPCGWAKAHGLQLHPPRGGICFCFFLLEIYFFSLEQSKLNKRTHQERKKGVCNWSKMLVSMVQQKCKQ